LGVRQSGVSLSSDLAVSSAVGDAIPIPSHPRDLIASHTVSAGALASSSPRAVVVAPVPLNAPGATRPDDAASYECNPELNWNAITSPDVIASNTLTPDAIKSLAVAAPVPQEPVTGFETPAQPFHGADDPVFGSVSSPSGGVNWGSDSPKPYVQTDNRIGASNDLAALFAVPEPATLGFGFIVPVLLRRRRRPIA
jgi:hypothetical protein